MVGYDIFYEGEGESCSLSIKSLESCVIPGPSWVDCIPNETSVIYADASNYSGSTSNEPMSTLPRYHWGSSISYESFNYP